MGDEKNRSEGQSGPSPRTEATGPVHFGDPQPGDRVRLAPSECALGTVDMVETRGAALTFYRVNVWLSSEECEEGCGKPQAAPRVVSEPGTHRAVPERCDAGSSGSSRCSLHLRRPSWGVTYGAPRRTAAAVVSRRVFTCDWCGAEAPSGSRSYENATPKGWRTVSVRSATDWSEVCDGCVKAYDDAMVAARKAVRDQRMALGAKKKRKVGG